MPVAVASDKANNLGVRVVYVIGIIIVKTSLAVFSSIMCTHIKHDLFGQFSFWCKHWPRMLFTLVYKSGRSSIEQSALLCQEVQGWWLQLNSDKLQQVAIPR